VPREARIGPIQVHFQQEGHRVVMTTSGDTDTIKRISDDKEVLESREVPTWIEMTTSGGPDPDMHVRVELRDGSPVATELSWKSMPGQSEIRMKHLRQTDITKLVTDLVVSTIWRGEVPLGEEVPDATALRQSKLMAQKFVERQRLPRERRVMTDDFLRSVAQVYRENIDGNPTEAVAKVFNVRPRMASTYVAKARAARLLPRTKQGQKKA
jgi:hypothetical protein